MRVRTSCRVPNSAQGVLRSSRSHPGDKRASIARDQILDSSGDSLEYLIRLYLYQLLQTTASHLPGQNLLVGDPWVLSPHCMHVCGSSRPCALIGLSVHRAKTVSTKEQPRSRPIAMHLARHAHLGIRTLRLPARVCEVLVLVGFHRRISLHCLPVHPAEVVDEGRSFPQHGRLTSLPEITPRR